MLIDKHNMVLRPALHLRWYPCTPVVMLFCKTAACILFRPLHSFKILLIRNVLAGADGIAQLMALLQGGGGDASAMGALAGMLGGLPAPRAQLPTPASSAAAAPLQVLVAHRQPRVPAVPPAEPRTFPPTASVAGARGIAPCPTIALPPVAQQVASHERGNGISSAGSGISSTGNGSSSASNGNSCAGIGSSSAGNGAQFVVVRREHRQWSSAAGGSKQEQVGAQGGDAAAERPAAVSLDEMLDVWEASAQARVGAALAAARADTLMVRCSLLAHVQAWAII